MHFLMGRKTTVSPTKHDKVLTVTYLIEIILEVWC